MTWPSSRACGVATSCLAVRDSVHLGNLGVFLSLALIFLAVKLLPSVDFYFGVGKKNDGRILMK